MEPLKLNVKLSPRVQKGLIWAAYGVGYLFCLVIFMYFTFPYERLKQRLVSAYNASQTGPNPSRMDVEDLTWSWRFPGLVAEGIRLIGPEPPPAPEGKPKEPQRIVRVDEVYARASIFSLLAGAYDVSFAAEAFGGEMDGSFSTSEEADELEVELEDVNPGDLPELASTVGVPLNGKVTGQVQLLLPKGKLSQANGLVDLEISDLTVSDGKTKIQNMITLPTVQAGTLTFKASVKAGRVKLDEFKGRGPDLEVDAEGKLRLRDKYLLSSADVTLRFKFTDKFRGKNDMTKALLGEPGSAAGGLFDSVDPRVKRAKAPDGSYTWRMSGTVGQLHFNPSSKRLGTSPGQPAPRAKTPRRAPALNKVRKPKRDPTKQEKPPSGSGVVLPPEAYGEPGGDEAAGGEEQPKPAEAPPAAEAKPEEGAATP